MEKGEESVLGRIRMPWTDISIPEPRLGRINLHQAGPDPSIPAGPDPRTRAGRACCTRLGRVPLLPGGPSISQTRLGRGPARPGWSEQHLTWVGRQFCISVGPDSQAGSIDRQFYDRIKTMPDRSVTRPLDRIKTMPDRSYRSGASSQ